MNSDSDVAISIAEQAAHWWVLFHDGEASLEDHQEFRDWVVRSPERVEAYLRIARLNQALRSPGVRWPETPAEELVREANASSPDVTSLSFRKSGPRVNHPRGRVESRTRVFIGLAAMLLIGVGSAWFVWRPLQLQTQFGEQRSFLLADGSRVTLNSASKIEVRLRKNRRLVSLVVGEALFDVAHDSARPFEVRAGQATLRAVGTQFDVDVRPTRTTVTVAEGRVAVLSAGEGPEHGTPMPTLGAADQLVITPAGALVPQHGVNVTEALSWTQDKIIFEHRSVGDVAEEFNRYNRERIQIASKELRDQEITGAFTSNDPNSFLEFLSNIPGVRIRGDGAGGHVVTVDESASSGR